MDLEYTMLYPWAAVMTAALSRIKPVYVCVSATHSTALQRSIKCSLRYVPLLTGLWWQAAILSAADNAAFGLVFWLQWQQVCWLGVDGVDGPGDKQPTCLEQSHYLMELVAAALTVYFEAGGKKITSNLDVWNKCERVFWPKTSACCAQRHFYV